MNFNHHENCGICHTEYCEHIQAEIDKRIQATAPFDVNSVALALCPFCGNEATLDGEAEWMTVTMYVTCNECECGARIKMKGSWNHEKQLSEEVVAKWNARATNIVNERK